MIYHNESKYNLLVYLSKLKTRFIISDKQVKFSYLFAEVEVFFKNLQNHIKVKCFTQNKKHIGVLKTKIGGE